MGLLQKLLGIKEGGYSNTLFCQVGRNTFIPCDILEEYENGDTLVWRKSDGQRFIVGVRDDVYSNDYGWVTIFSPGEAIYL